METLTSATADGSTEITEGAELRVTVPESCRVYVRLGALTSSGTAGTGTEAWDVAFEGYDAVVVPSTTGPHVSSRLTQTSPRCSCCTMACRLWLRTSCVVTTSMVPSSPDSPPIRIDSNLASSTGMSAVSVAIILMKIVPGVPGSFTRAEWLAFATWTALGLVFWKLRPVAPVTGSRMSGR